MTGFFPAWKHLQIMIVSSNTGAFIKVPFMDSTTSLVRNCSHNCEIVFSFWSHSWIEIPRFCLPFRLVVFYEHQKNSGSNYSLYCRRGDLRTTTGITSCDRKNLQLTHEHTNRIQLFTSCNIKASLFDQ